MKHSLAVAIVVVCVAAAPRLAHAAWYYTWSCSGECAPGQLAITGVEGPFASQSECDAYRSQDSRAAYFVAPGNLGGLTFCEESDSPPSPGGSSSGGPRGPLPTQRIAVHAVLGPGWKARDVENSASENITAGFGFDWRISGNPRFAIATTVSVLITHFVAGSLGPDGFTPILVPVTIGLAATPGNRKLRFDLGAAGGFEFPLACGVPGHSCSGFYGELHAGVDLYNKPQSANGFAAEAVITGAEGGGLASPGFMIRVSLIHRNLALE